MAITITKPEINLREKLKELDFETVPFQKMPSGSVLQVVEETASIGVLTTSTSFVNSNISAAITPISASSKIVIQTLAHVHASVQAQEVRVNISKESSGSYTDLTSSGQPFRIMIVDGSFNPNSYIYLPIVLAASDEPNTTSEISYHFRFKSTDGESVEVFNDRGKGKIVLMEIAG